MATTTRSHSVPVAECYGPVWQGEGPYAGQVCTFLRLGYCNLTCTWCDTPYTWDSSRFDLRAEFTDRSYEWLCDRIPFDRLLVITGGEPLLHQKRSTFAALIADCERVHIETNGTIAPSEEAVTNVEYFSVSPKINDQGDAWDRRIRPNVIRVFDRLARKGKACFKLVAQGPSDVERIAYLVDEFGIRSQDVWIMPEGISPDQVLETARRVADSVRTHGFNLTLRNHVLMYGAERGT